MLYTASPPHWTSGSRECVQFLRLKVILYLARLTTDTTWILLIDNSLCMSAGLCNDKSLEHS